MPFVGFADPVDGGSTFNSLEIQLSDVLSWSSGFVHQRPTEVDGFKERICIELTLALALLREEANRIWVSCRWWTWGGLGWVFFKTLNGTEFSGV
jgi:hypothetical protein